MKIAESIQAMIVFWFYKKTKIDLYLSGGEMFDQIED